MKVSLSFGGALRVLAGPACAALLLGACAGAPQPVPVPAAAPPAAVK